MAVPSAVIDELNSINGDYSVAQVILSGQRSSGTIVKRSWEFILGAAGGFVTIIMGAFAGVAGGIRAFDVIVCGGCLSCGSIEPKDLDDAKKGKEKKKGEEEEALQDAAAGGQGTSNASSSVAPAPASAAQAHTQVNNPTTTSGQPAAGFASAV